MPIFSSVRRTGKVDSSTSWMISSFSEAGYLMRRSPHPPSRFFEQAIFERQLGHDLLQRAGLAPQVLDLSEVAARAVSPASRFFPPSRKSLTNGNRGFGQSPRDAELGDTVLAAQAFQYDADLVFRREVSPRRPPDILYDLYRRLFLRHRFCLIFAP